MKTDYTGKNKLQGGCEPYNNVWERFVPCDKQGERRIDNGLDAGIHCDKHWIELVKDCRKRSW